MTELSPGRAQLLDSLLRRRIGTPERQQRIPKVPAGTEVPLTPAQARIWFFTHLYPDSAEYNVFETLTFDHAPTRTELRTALSTLMGRHDALRAAVRETGDAEDAGEAGGTAVQHDSGLIEPPLEWHDLREATGAEADRRAREIGDAAAAARIALDSPPLLRAVAVALPGGRLLLVLVLHHLVTDYWSTKQLVQELCSLLAGEPLDAPGEVGFLDYAAWLAAQADEERVARDLGYWKRQLGGELPVLDLPADRPRPSVPSRRGGVVPLDVPAEDAGHVRRLAEEEGTTPFVVLLAAYKALILRLTGQPDVIVGAPLAGRDHPVTEDIVGCFIKPVALRTDVTGDLSFRALVRRVHDTVVGAQDHQSVPFERVVAELGIPRTAGGSPVFQTFFGLQSADGLSIEGARWGEVVLDSASAKWDLTVSLTETPDSSGSAGCAGASGFSGFSGFVEYAFDLFDEPTVRRYTAAYRRLLDSALRDADTALRDLDLLSGAERDHIVHGLNPYRRPELPYRTMAEPFEEQAARTPGAVALEGDEGTLTYGELNARANRLAHFLRSAGAGRGTFVALCAERGFDMITALYAIAKSGAAYVPLDPELPDGRLEYMLQDAGALLVLTDDTTRERIGEGPWHTYSLGKDAHLWAALPTGDVPAEGPGNHLVHLLYTSGTTGRPKAVAYGVDGALANIFWLQEKYPFGPGDANLLKTSYGFDVSIWEIFWPLYFGARLAVCRPGGHKDPGYLREMIERHGVTTVYLIPTMMQVFLENAPAGSCPSLRWVFCGGEPVTPRIRDGFHERFDAALINCYGPTEAGCVTDMVLPRDPGAPVPLGRPAGNFRLYVLDENLALAPVGVPGEAFIGGESGVAQNYHRHPGMTAERFLPDPYGPPGSRMYRTGDLCRYRADGVLEHLGRIGRQVKIRGMRIELAEIEAVLCEHPDVEDAVVLAPQSMEQGTDRRLAAFVVPREGHTSDARELAEHAARLLPAYMLPSRYTEVPHVPMNVNGKADEKALLRHLGEGGAPERQRTLVPPEGEVETGLTEIFRRVLGTEDVGVTDGFFELGGHSLLIFRLIAACSQELRLRPTVSDVFAAPTVRELAARLRSSADEARTCLVPLAPAKGRPLLVLVHAASGSVLPFLETARRLEGEFDVYGIEAPQDAEGRLAGSVEQLAAHYASAVDAVRGVSPVVLAGWSMGGCVALEMARQWRERAVDVTATLLLDSWAPPALAACTDGADGTGGGMGGAARVRAAILGMDIFALEGFEADTLDEAAGEVHRLEQAVDHHRAAFLDYDPAPYDGAVDLLRATEVIPEVRGALPDGYLTGDRGWSCRIGEVTVRDVPGNHFTLLAKENAEELAKAIRETVEARLSFEEF
ncbi:non-ribosomal peptide synthetase [Streptomyces daliensis]|uniref:Amino acid adenylation domain-containing protein n=1 Tax=Streptomyces daliensis TaxID=299421 RepID=A0A8T4IPG2_9ACTN|nr:amino acid adenylation domain-containing protein [Streptomyces daliensis]